MNRDLQIRAAVGAVIREARKARGLRLKQLAALADLDWSQLSKVERGQSRVSDATLERVAQELGFTLPALYAAALSRAAPKGSRAVVRRRASSATSQPTHSRT
jgi:transcriptional regulator with XRE-family HTH domain